MRSHYGWHIGGNIFIELTVLGPLPEVRRRGRLVPAILITVSRGSRKMAKIARQLIIGDYAQWRAGFDRAAPFREKAGMKNTQIYRDVDDPTEVLIWSEVDDPNKAREILESPDVRSAMRAAGVLGNPKFHVIP